MQDLQEPPAAEGGEEIPDAGCTETVAASDLAAEEAGKMIAGCGGSCDMKPMMKAM